MKISRTALWLVTALLVIAGHGTADDGKSGFTPLFDGETLDGWKRLGGEAKYHVENGQIVGTTVPNTGNTFLVTERSYGDFILELEFKVDPQLNSGVQIRSNSTPSYKNGRVHGYQVEIDPSNRAWSGGIYDEARRGWLNNLEDNEPARDAFKQNEWNEFRIVAAGDSIQTWINGVPAADLTDDMTSTGFIGLQVHGVGGREEPLQVRWRNIRIKSLDQGESASLFDGETLDGWVTADGEPVTGGWVVEDGVIHRKSGGGDIFTHREFDDFDLRLEWKISSGGNSGVKYRVKEYDGRMLGPEYQVLDDAEHSEGANTKGSTASLYALFAPAEDKKLHPAGEWNRTRIVVRGTRFEHWLNGQKVLEVDTAGDRWAEAIAESKFAEVEGFGQNEWGRIMLQDHGDEVWYRSIEIRPLLEAE